MPQPRILDFGPDYLAEAFGRAGRSFGDRAAENYGVRREDDAITKILSQVSPGMNDEDLSHTIFSQRGLPLEKKMKLLDSLQKSNELSRKSALQQQLFGGRGSEEEQLYEQQSSPEGELTEQGEALQSPEGEDVVEQISAKPRQKEPMDVTQISDEQLVQLEQIDPKLAKALRDIKKSRREEFLQDRDYHSKKSDKYLEEIEASAAEMESQQAALNQMEQAVTDKSYLGNFADWFADVSGAEIFRTAKGAQLVGAKKDFLIKSIRGLAGRPNQWIEQQINSMFATAGRSEEANQKSVAILKASLAKQNHKNEIAMALRDAYEEKLGYVPRNISSQVDQLTKDYNKKEEKRLEYDLQRLSERYDGYSLKSVKKGTPLTLGMASHLMEKYNDKEVAMAQAKKLGYYIPDEEVWAQYAETEE